MDIIVLSSNEEIRNLIVETLSDTRRLTGITGITAGNMSISADPKKHSAAVIVSPLADVFGLDSGPILQRRRCRRCICDNVGKCGKSIG